MNWKIFLAEFHTVESWLSDRKVKEAQRKIFGIIAMILAGYSQPQSILQQVLASEFLADIFSEKPVYEKPEFTMPVEIETIIWRWLGSLPHNDAVLGEIYERLSRKKRIQGVYYTPGKIVDFIIAHTLEQFDVIENPDIRILDPACGCGFFLLKAYDVLFEKLSQNSELLNQKFPLRDWSPEGIHRHILQNNLWGSDIDEQAIEIACIGLQLKQVKTRNIVNHLIVYDSLQRPEDAENLPLAVRHFWEQRYECVLGNPPYLSFGLRGAKQMSADYRAYLRQAYPESAEYKLSYYVLFMQRGIELLCPNGRLGFIVPDSFLLGRYYSKIRKYIMEHTLIEILAHISTTVFKTAITGYACICILKANDNKQRRDNQLISIMQVDSLRQLPGAEAVCQYEQNYFSSLPYQRFRVFFDLEIKQIVDHLDRTGILLGNFVSGHTGIRSISCQSDIISSRCCGPTWQRGLISGSQVWRYGIKYGGHWINIDKQKLYQGGWRSDIISRSKLLVRQTGYMLTACIDGNGYYHLNNIHSFVARNHSVHLEYLLMLLNSRLMSFYYHAVSMEYGRAMAQTDIETLEKLPIIVNSAVDQSAPELVRTMMACVEKKIAGKDNVDNKIKALDDYFNQVVYKVYGLSEREIAIVEQYEEQLLVKK
ncbi:hypothetical protein P22_0057 [Propionispora sp. 2/2-37]|uniref:Eco57I restriction-modification methylase domain-containing protein n=1 Tax=Propionispora sp. 2/2-37 TaxID=1677858 RepID=UPI0006BB8F7E|nr:N-6 DNA methylase [Propionispora sp. 2/2-37]CUH93995.1 hypothetical protein P22_0057 [Propionispora sp. 2/2-37]